MADAWADQVWELVPFQRIGPLLFEMSRDEVARILGHPSAVLEEEPIVIEAYDDVQPGYDRAGRLVAVHTGPGRAVVFGGIRLSDRGVRDVEDDLRSAGVCCRRDPDGALSAPELGVEFLAEELSCDPGTVRGLFVKGRRYTSVAGSPTS